MTQRYVKSTTGNNSNGGTSWADAKATLTGVDAIDTAGDSIYLSSAHNETNAGSLTLNLAGTAAAPSSIVCADDAATPPTAAATTATVSALSAGANVTLNGFAYLYGINFALGSAGSSSTFQAGSTVFNTQTYENCTIDNQGSGASSRVAAGNEGTSNPGKITFKNCTLKFASAGSRLAVSSDFRWNGGGIASGSTALNSLLIFGARNTSNAIVSGVDLSNIGASANLVDGSIAGSGRVIFRDCKLPTSWTGSLWSVVPTALGMRAEMHNCDSGATNYRLWVEDYAGSIKSETALVKTGGASDGTTAMSWKMVSSANAGYPLNLLESPEIAIWNPVVGSAITVALDILRDSATSLTDGEVWIEAQYLSSSGAPLSNFISDVKATILATAAAQDASSAAWATTGMSSPNKQKLSVSFTPQMAGYIKARVILAKANTTIYVDPKLSVT